uniref:Inhibitor of nuclear factor kappa-B kinase-interacting protein n=1 Tax=Zeugodacus cucurbitae TaxID=28588 RepID=A0A0A1WXF4_ZEUCU
MAEQQRKTVSDQLLRAQLEVVTAQNARLQEENNLLRQKLSRLSGDSRSAAAINVEAKINALRLEDERDQMYDNLERLKRKYNKLHAAYLEKVQRCKALEDTFKRQKTLSGLVMKSALSQRAQVLADKTQTENLEKQVTKLQTALDEAYDIIDELEFELESIDYMEQEMLHMRNELTVLKSKQKEYTGATTSSIPTTELDESLPAYTADIPDGPGCRYSSGPARRISRNVRSMLIRPNASSSSNESLPNDDADNETLERAAMTHDLLENAAAESNQLRRELLKCRLQNRCRPK